MSGPVPLPAVAEGTWTSGPPSPPPGLTGAGSASESPEPAAQSEHHTDTTSAAAEVGGPDDEPAETPPEEGSSQSKKDAVPRGQRKATGKRTAKERFERKAAMAAVNQAATSVVLEDQPNARAAAFGALQRWSVQQTSWPTVLGRWQKSEPSERRTMCFEPPTPQHLSSGHQFTAAGFTCVPVEERDRWWSAASDVGRFALDPRDERCLIAWLPRRWRIGPGS